MAIYDSNNRINDGSLRPLCDYDEFKKKIIFLWTQILLI